MPIDHYAALLAACAGTLVALAALVVSVITLLRRSVPARPAARPACGRHREDSIGWYLVPPGWSPPPAVEPERRTLADDWRERAEMPDVPELPGPDPVLVRRYMFARDFVTGVTR